MNRPQSMASQYARLEGPDFTDLGEIERIESLLRSGYAHSAEWKANSRRWLYVLTMKKAWRFLEYASVEEYALARLRIGKRYVQRLNRASETEYRMSQVVEGFKDAFLTETVLGVLASVWDLTDRVRLYEVASSRQK